MAKKNTKKNKLVSEMTISEVLQMPLFYQKAEKEIANILNDRISARRKLRAGERLKAHPIDDLHSLGFMETGAFIVVYAKVLEKTETELSSAKRNFILGFGNGIFKQTVQKLLDDEKAGNNSIRNHRQ